MPALNANELQTLRDDTPALNDRAHFAHGSASLPPSPVFQALQRWLDLERRHGGHRAASLLEQELGRVREGVAAMIGAKVHQVAFLDSASRAWAMALEAACDNRAGTAGVAVLTTIHEWGGTAINLLHARARNRIAQLRVVEEAAPESLCASVGRSLDRYLEESAGREPELLVVSVPMVAAIDGHQTAAADIAGIASRVRACGGLLFLDASHVAGRAAIDVAELACDVLVFPARKWLRGPKATSVLYLSDRALDMLGAPPTLEIASARWLDGARVEPMTQAARFEVHEYHPGSRLALGVACEYAMRVGIERIGLRNRAILDGLGTRLRDALGLVAVTRDLQAAAQTDLQTAPQAGARSAFLTYEIAAGGQRRLMCALDAAGINASLIGRQHALWALESRGLGDVLRLTPHYFTADEEIERLVVALTANRRLLA